MDGENKRKGSIHGALAKCQEQASSPCICPQATRGGLVSSTLPRGGWVSRRWVPSPHSHSRGLAAPHSNSSWQALSPPTRDLPQPWPPRNQAFQPARRLPDHPGDFLSLPTRTANPQATCGSSCQQDGPWSGGTRVLRWFHASVHDEEASFSFHGRPEEATWSTGLGCSQAEGTAGCHWALT